MVTPGARLPLDENCGPDEDHVDEDGDTRMVNDISANEADTQNVPMLSEVYGMHPRKLIFDNFGYKIEPGHDEK